MLGLLSYFPINFLTVSALLTFLAYKYITRSFNYWKNKNVPFVPPTPLFGNFYPIVSLQEGIGNFLETLYNRMHKEPYFGIWIFNTPLLVVKSPELVKAVLLKDFDYFTDRTIVSDKKTDPIGSKLLFLEKNPDWKVSRKRLTPAFTSGKIKTMIPLINDCADGLKEFLTKNIAQDSNVEAKELAAKFTTAVISSCVFGLDAGCFENEDSKFRDVGRKMFSMDVENAVRATSYFFLPSFVKTFQIYFCKPEIYTFLKDAFTQTIDHRMKVDTKRNDLVDMLVQMKKDDEANGVVADDEKLIAHAIQFFLAGFETTSSTIAFTLYEICLNTVIQDKLRVDIIENIRKYGVTYESIQNMKYLDNVISETLRKYPVLPFLDRRCVKDYILPGTNVKIDKGTPVYISMSGLHYDPKYWTEPNLFNPDRFTEENSVGRPAFAYIPFGQGPHNCIGERFGLISSKLGIIHILTQFEVRRNKETPVPIIFDPKSFVLQSTVGLPMDFVKYNPRTTTVG